MTEYKLIGEDERQAMGFAASAWLRKNDPAGLDWCDGRNVDQLLDAMLAAAPAMPGEPVALPPFVELVTKKLLRVDECFQDNQHADVGSRWLEILVHMDLLNRVQRSPARWQISQQGRDLMDWHFRRPAEQRCEYCDGTGDVHSADGEWRGTCSCPAGQPSSADSSLTPVPDELFTAEFYAWWEQHGQLCRSGGGDYERTFAFEAWRHLYPKLMNLQMVAAEQQPIKSSLAFEAAEHLTRWLDMGMCECEMGHTCGYTQVERTRDALLGLVDDQHPAPCVSKPGKSDPQGALAAESERQEAGVAGLVKALERLIFAAQCRDSTSGDQIRLVAVRAELADAATNAQAVIATHRKGGEA